MAQIAQDCHNNVLSHHLPWFLKFINRRSTQNCAAPSAHSLRIPESTFNESSSNDILAYYEKTVNDIKTYLNEAQADVVIRKAMESIENASQMMLLAASSDDTASIIAAAKLLTDAAKSLTVAAANAESNNNYSIVFVYDIEEITMLSKNHIAEYSQKFTEIESSLLSTYVKSVLHRAKFSGPRELHDGDVINIQNAVPDETDIMRKVAPKYDALRQLYNEIETIGLPINYEFDEEFVAMKNNLNHVVEQLQHKTHQRWQSVKRCLDLVNQKSLESPNKFANVVISKEGVAMGAAQLLVSKHAQMIPIENIYSTAKLSRKEVFGMIRKKFGEKCVLVYITSKKKYLKYPKAQYQIWPVEAADSIDKLYEAQRDFLVQ